MPGMAHPNPPETPKTIPMTEGSTKSKILCVPLLRLRTMLIMVKTSGSPPYYQSYFIQTALTHCKSAGTLPLVNEGEM